MGVSIKLRETSFQLKAEHFDAALAAIKATDGPAYPSLGRPLRNAPTLKDALQEWSWFPDLDDAGDITGLRLAGSYANNDEVLFAAIAPFVTSGSWIEMQFDEGDGGLFRYVFRDGKMREVYPTVTWPEE
jgi:hypothetical protein